MLATDKDQKTKQKNNQQKIYTGAQYNIMARIFVNKSSGNKSYQMHTPPCE